MSWLETTKGQDKFTFSSPEHIATTNTYIAK